MSSLGTNFEMNLNHRLRGGMLQDVFLNFAISVYL